MKKLLLILMFAVTAFGQITDRDIADAEARKKKQASPVVVVSKAESVPSKADEKEIIGAFTQMADEKICLQCTWKRYDKMTNETDLHGNRIIVSANKRKGFLIDTAKYGRDGMIALNFKLVGVSSCIDANASILFLFRDGTRLSTESSNALLNPPKTRSQRGDRCVSTVILSQGDAQ